MTHSVINLELPPRARRIPVSGISSVMGCGTTSACAENTGAAMTAAQEGRNYLRVRGEYQMELFTHDCNCELPPRARRIQRPGVGKRIHLGTTSACAENTGSTPPPDPRDGNYLRVRGEYPPHHPTGSSYRELPPRARRIRQSCCLPCSSCGTTSACAENTAYMRANHRPRRNYLRVRGEYMMTPVSS